MKRKLLILFVLILTLVACRQSQGKITYTEEFPYLPEHPGMIFNSFEESPDNEFEWAYYTVQGVIYETFLEEYESILVSDGWEVVQDSKPHSLSVQKSNYGAVLILQETGEEAIGLVILSK